MCRYVPGIYHACPEEELIHVPGTWKYTHSPSKRHNIRRLLVQNVIVSICPRHISRMSWTRNISCPGDIEILSVSIEVPWYTVFFYTECKCVVMSQGNITRQEQELIHVPGTWKYKQSPSRRHDMRGFDTECKCVDISQGNITHAMNRN